MSGIRRLNEEGLTGFRSWLEGQPSSPAPLHLLTTPESSEPVQDAGTIQIRDFTTRLELGQYIGERLAGVPTARIRFDVGLWDWLSLFYINVLAPLRADGTREMKEIFRYRLELKNRKWSRHIVRMSWMTVADHGKFARVMLALPITKQSEVIEQLAGQQEAFGAPSVVEVADKLYWDEVAGALKRGAQGKKAGTPRRLVRFMRQFRRTFDPPAMKTDQLVNALPREFDRWKGSAPPRAKAAMRDNVRDDAGARFGSP